MLNTASALIDLAALRHNLDIVRALCPHSRILAMIKADGYGHGALPVARALARADGFAVARLQEARELREAGISQRLLLLGTLLEPEELEQCSAHDIDVTAYDEASVEAIVGCAARHPLRVWVKLDCGMHRLGLEPVAWIRCARRLAAVRGVNELIHMTHFSTTRDMTGLVMRQQIERFTSCHEALRCEGAVEAAVSVANSAVLIARPELRAAWVRPGIMLFGDNPLAAAHPLPLRAVMTLRSRVIAVRSIGTGESVGYDGCWTSQRPSRIATVGIGYGDGYPRHAANGTPVRINGREAPLAGRVSMDSLTVDVTDLDHVATGDEVTLWGAELPAATIAEYARTASYELFTGLTARVAREYIGAA